SMMALAFGPGKAVLISGAVIVAMGVLMCEAEAALLSLPPRAAGIVLEQHTAGRQLAANLIGRSEVAAAPRGVTIVDELLDFVERHGRLFFFRLPEAQHAEDPIEPRERPLDALRIVDTDAAEIDGRVHRVN